MSSRGIAAVSFVVMLAIAAGGEADQVRGQRGFDKARVDSRDMVQSVERLL